MRVLNYKQYKMTEDLINFLLNPVINESDDRSSEIEKILKTFSKDLKFNFSLVFTFGVGVKAMYPIVENLINNGTLQIEPTIENIVLVSIAALTITYLEETKNKAGDSKVACSCEVKDKNCEICDGTGYVNSLVTKKDAQTILEELKLRGIGNGIVKKLVLCFKSIGNIVKMLFKNSPYVINGLLDMLAYTAILIPTMNAISALVDKYELTMDTLPGNFLALGFGVTTFLTKHGFDYLVKKLKSKLNLKVDDLETPTIAKSYDIADGDSNNDNLDKNDKLIKEQ